MIFDLMFWGVKQQLRQNQLPEKLVAKTPIDMDVSENRGTPKSSILIGFSIINHPLWDTLIFGNTHMCRKFIESKVPQRDQCHP